MLFNLIHRLRKTWNRLIARLEYITPSRWHAYLPLFLIILGIGLVVSVTTTVVRETVSTNTGHQASETRSSNLFLQPSIPVADTCDVDHTTKTVAGDSMSPMIQNGQRLEFLENYYRTCRVFPQTWDVVAHRYSGEVHPVIKMVRATDQDRIEIRGTSLYVNGKPLQNSAGQEYSFTKGELLLLKLYADTGKLPAKSYFVFGDNTGTSIDSRKFWAISSDDILGKFVIDGK